MSYLGSLFGTQSGNMGGAGMNFNATGVPIQNAVSDEQMKAAQDAVLAGTAQQQNFANAVGAQNGLGMQGAAGNAYRGLMGQQAGMGTGNQALAGAAGANMLAGMNGQNPLGMQNNSLAQQQAFTNSLGGGGQNMANALSAQGNLAGQMAGANGVGNQSSVFGQQQALANQLGDLSQGRGPNPALAQLAQTTGQNTANQAALMASQRGANANVGLMGRQIAAQGAANQQNAAGQAATMSAQQQLAAMNALQQQQSSMGNLASTQANQLQNQLQALYGNSAGQAGMYGQQLGQQLGQANAMVGQNLAQQQALGNLGSTQVNQYQNSIGGLGGLGSQLSQQQQAAINAAQSSNLQNAGQMYNAVGQKNSNLVGMQSNINNANEGIANTVAQGQQKTAGGITNAAGAIPGMFGGSSGGAISGGMPLAGGAGDAGGLTGMAPIAMMAAKGGEIKANGTIDGPMSSFGKYITGQKVQPYMMADGGETPAAPQAPKQPFSDVNVDLSNTPARRQSAAPTVAAARGANGGLMPRNMTAGGPVGGKAKVKGNSYANDTQPALLSPGEIVIPRSVTQHPDAVNKSAQFVQAILAKHSMRK